MLRKLFYKKKLNKYGQTINFFKDRRSEVESILQGPNASSFFEIPDKLGNLPLVIAIIRNHFE